MTIAENMLRFQKNGGVKMADYLQYISATTLLLAALVLAAIAFTIIYKLFKTPGDQSIAGFIFEEGADGKKKPSVSRLQMLIWNFVVAFSFLYIVGSQADISKGIGILLDGKVLGLLAISNGTYVIGKVTKQGSAKKDPVNPSDPEAPSPDQPSPGK